MNKAKPEELKTIARKLDDIIEAHPAILGTKDGSQKGALPIAHHNITAARDAATKEYDRLSEKDYKDGKKSA